MWSRIFFKSLEGNKADNTSQSLCECTGINRFEEIQTRSPNWFLILEQSYMIVRAIKIMDPPCQTVDEWVGV